LSSTETLSLKSPVREADARLPALTEELPFISIVIPTRNRGRYLPYLFEALAEEEYPTDKVEVIVVDDSSTDNTRQLIEEWKERLPFPLITLQKERKGPAAARNLGVSRARGEVIAFTDSDCVPSPQWLRAGARGIGLGATIVCGPIDPRRLDGTHWLFNAQLNPVTSDTGLYPTANFFVKRSAFESVGGFREDVSGWGEHFVGEDTDLAWRIKKQGRLALFLSDVSVVHLATPLSLWRWLLRPMFLAVIPRLLRTIPELRGVSLWCGFFLSRRHFFFDLAALGVLSAAITRWWWPLLLTMPWLWVVVRGHLMGALKRNPIKAAALFILVTQQFALTLVVLLAASVRYRRLVL
jgi:glycosyltransferase involved in cell wall biosynthesis